MRHLSCATVADIPDLRRLNATMTVLNYVACLFAGMFLTNAVPHFVKGICGDSFPTPFAKPPGKGLSSPLVNVLWGFLNIVIGYLLFKSGHVAIADTLGIVLFFVGAAAMGLMGDMNFVHKHSS
jgi:hypothetical protein